MTREERLERLFRAHYGDVLAYAIRRCPSRQDAEDVAAETFTVAWRRIEEVPEAEAARVWLFGTARLVRLNLHRTTRRRGSLLDRLRGRLLGSGGSDPGIRVPEGDRIRQALAALSPDDREILALHAWEGLSASEIAQVLGISTPAVWKRLQRARQRLAEALRQASDHDAVATHLPDPLEGKALS